MYQVMYLDERVSISASEMNLITSHDSIKEIIETKLRELHEGKCNSNGFVRPGSLKLLARSMGVAENGRFTGNIIYDCKISCEILYPTVGSEIKVSIIKVNRMGAYGVFDEAIRVLLPRDLHVGSMEFDGLKEGDTVKIVLDRSRFQAKDSFIMAVGHLVGTTGVVAPAINNSVGAPVLPTVNEKSASIEEEEEEE